MQFNAYTASQVTLGSSAPVVEQKYPLWVYSSGTVADATSSNNCGIQKGSTTVATAGSWGSATKLLNLSSSWSPTQKFAFEVSFYVNNSSNTGYAALWDLTTTTIISASQISTTSTTSTLTRSGTFTLTPGHSYGVSIWSPTGSPYLSKAYLVALFT